MAMAFEELSAWFIKRLNDQGFGELRDQLVADFPEEKPQGEPSTGIVEGTGHGTLTNAGGCGGGSSGVHLYACDDEYSTRWNTPASPRLIIQSAPGVMANDHDTDWTHTITSWVSSFPLNGSLNLASDGGFTYTPDDGYIGADMFWYYVVDGFGGNASAPVTIYVYEPDVDVDSNNDGSLDPDNSYFGTDDPIEADWGTPGMVLAVNDDDDNGNGVPDNHANEVTPFVDNLGQPMADDDLMPVNLAIPFENGFLKDRWVELEFSSPSLKLWDSQQKNNEIVFVNQPNPPLPGGGEDPHDNWWKLGSEPVPQVLWLEGMSTLPLGGLLQFILDPTAPTAEDDAFVTVASVNLHADSDNDGDVDASFVEELIEMDAPGSVLRHNLDDDNDNARPDWMDGLIVNSQGQTVIDDELELVTLELNAGGVELTGFTVELLPSNNNIALWLTQGKQPLREDLTYTIGTHALPTPIFVEGIDTGQAQLDMILRDPQNNLVYHDTVLFTVMNTDAVAYRPQTESYGSPFAKTAVPEELESSPGVGIRHNGDTDTVENDLIEVDLINLPNPAVGIEYVLTRSNKWIDVWDDKDKSDPLLVGLGLDTMVLNPQQNAAAVWVEWKVGTPTPPATLTATLTFQARTINTGNVVMSDVLTFYPFTSIVIVLGGEGQVPSDPIVPPNAGNFGVFQFAIDEYRNGYDVHMYDEDDVSWFTGEGPAFDEVASAIEHRGVTNVAIIGYSRGGGAVYQLVERLSLDPDNVISRIFFVQFTSYIDAITSYTGGAENRRPVGTNWHQGQWQTNSTFLRGGPSNADAGDDINRTGLGVTHQSIDDHSTVINLVKTRLAQKVPRR